MTPERAAGAVARWVRFYTRQLPTPVAQRRSEEVAADVRDQIEFERGRKIGEWRIALGLMSRMARGMADDIAWKTRARPVKGDLLKPFVLVLGVAIGVAFLALVLDSPLLVLASVALIGADVIGVFALGLRSAREGNFVLPYFAIIAGALVVSALAVAALVWGSAGDAPGLVLLGAALIVSVAVGAFALGIRTAQRSS